MTNAPNKGKGKGIAWLRDHIAYSGDDCLRWPYSRDTKGYGSFGYCGKVLRAHRMMCELAHGEPPTPKHQASHECGNGANACCNPRHLSWKTNGENQRDKRRHGTADNGGGRTNGGKLSPRQRHEIRALKGIVPIMELATRYGVKRGTIDREHRIARYGYDTNATNLRKSAKA